MTTFKKFYQQPNLTPSREFFHQLTTPQREKVSFFIILITSIFRNKSQTLYAVSCILNLPQRVGAVDSEICSMVDFFCSWYGIWKRCW